MNIIILANVSVLGQIGLVFLGIVIGGIAGFIISRKVFQKQLKKNPPINEKMIRAMFMEMGRKPNEAQIKRIMKNIKAAVINARTATICTEEKPISNIFRVKIPIQPQSTAESSTAPSPICDFKRFI